MVDKVKLPDFIKESAKAALEPLNKLEDRISQLRRKLAKERNLPPAEVKQVLNDAMKWVKGTRSEIEKSFSDGVARTLSILNLPSREDLQKLDKKVSKLAKEVSKLEGKKTTPKKPAKKKLVKKPAVKKPAVKKTAKK